MYEGHQRTYYGGIALGDGTFLLSAFVTELTGPDEVPYLTNQMRFDAVEGWQSQIWYPDDWITSYCMLDDPIALSCYGKLFNALSGEEIAVVDPRATGHFHTLTAFDGILTVAGDNGRYWSGPLTNLTYIDNPIHLPIPALDSGVEEMVAWAQKMKMTFTSLALGPREILIGGTKGFLVRIVDGAFHKIPVGVEAHVTGLCRGDDGTIYVCGHTPNSFVGIVHPDNTVQMLTELQNGPRLCSPAVFQGTLFMGALGPDGGIFTLTPRGLERASLPGPSDFGELGHLTTDNNRLWAVFERALVVVDGQSYRVHTHPSNM